MADDVPFYDDPTAESTFSIGRSGQQPVFVSNAAMVSVHLSNEFDKQKAKGSNFNRVKFLGINLAEFTVHWSVYPEDEVVFWRDIVPLCREKAKAGNSPPMDVINPQVNRCGIKTVIIDEINIEPPNAKDGRSVVLKIKEWAPAPTAPTKDTFTGVKPGQSVLSGAKKNG